MSRRRIARLAAALVATLALGACTAPDGGSGSGEGETGAGAGGGAETGEDAAGAPPRAEEPPEPPRNACYRISYQQALATVAPGRRVPCGREHSARTFALADLPTLVDGHLVAVDSARARRAPARECPRLLGGFLGGDPDARRLSMFQAVWFTPTLEEADEGANWFRCDVVLLAADRRLGSLEGRLGGVLDRPAGARYGMCGTAKPGADAFERVACARRHSWRAVRVIPLLPLADRQGRYPGTPRVREAGQTPCEETGRERAADPLTFEWGYEWPTRPQWRRGTTYGICWVPDRS